MRAFLIAFVCLSTLALLQNVVVATPATTSEAVGQAAAMERSLPARESGAHEAAAPPHPRRATPQPAATGLLVLGLSGLCAVGSRRTQRQAA